MFAVYASNAEGGDMPVHPTPDGRFLYSSERRSDTLAAFRVDALNVCGDGPAGRGANWVETIPLP